MRLQEFPMMLIQILESFFVFSMHQRWGVVVSGLAKGTKLGEEDKKKEG